VSPIEVPVRFEVELPVVLVVACEAVALGLEGFDEQPTKATPLKSAPLSSTAIFHFFITYSLSTNSSSRV
jgi:hypothetical protein